MEDQLKWLEAAMGAVSKIDSKDDDLLEGRCPKCNAADFAKISDLYVESVIRIESGEDPGAVHVGGLTDAQIVARFAPPPRRSAAAVAVAVAVPLAAGAYYVYRRFGDTLGQLAGIVALVITVIVLMTTLRRFSDQHYHRRRRRNSIFMCRKCGQLVASS